jgi:hypothetical protein
MRTLIYKRTHTGDPDVRGRFGIHDCMGQMRAWDFEAVIGIGGLGGEATSHGLDGKINWIGIGPHKRAAMGKRGPIVTFDHFLYYGSEGPDFITKAPTLAHRMYSRNVRVLMHDVDARERKEIDRLLTLARNAPPSAPWSERRTSRVEACPPATSRRAPKGCADDCD